MHQLKGKEQRNSHFSATRCLPYDLTEVSQPRQHHTKEVGINSVLLYQAKCEKWPSEKWTPVRNVLALFSNYLKIVRDTKLIIHMQKKIQRATKIYFQHTFH